MHQPRRPPSLRARPQQRAAAVHLLGDVGEVEVRRERARQLRGRLEVELGQLLERVVLGQRRGPARPGRAGPSPSARLRVSPEQRGDQADVAAQGGVGRAVGWIVHRSIIDGSAAAPVTPLSESSQDRVLPGASGHGEQMSRTSSGAGPAPAVLHRPGTPRLPAAERRHGAGRAGGLRAAVRRAAGPARDRRGARRRPERGQPDRLGGHRCPRPGRAPGCRPWRAGGGGCG